jgi:hypothetical protein
VQTGSVEMLAIGGGSVFLAPITVGGQQFYVVIDTGSSDPWLVDSSFTCIDPSNNEEQDESLCYFGPLYDRTASNTYEPFPDRSMNLSYADHETLNGLMGRDTFTMGGITFPAQEFGMVDLAAWYGDGVSSGLVGFAYRTLTSMYVGENPKAAVPGQNLKYNPFFDNLYRNNITEPVFSMALTRDPQNTGQGGVMGLGGVPDIPYAPTWISAPILPVGINRTSGEIEYQFYTITVDGFALSSDQSAQFASIPDAKQNPRKTALRGPVNAQDPNSSSVNAIVDSGTTLIYVSQQLAAAVVRAFDPPGAFDRASGYYLVLCTATPPIFGASIGGKVFNVNPRDMWQRRSDNISDPLCTSSVQSNGGPNGLWILGDAWMKSMLCVFDVGSSRMGFAGRQFYDLTWNGGKYY